jgi:hypothetical protein
MCKVFSFHFQQILLPFGGLICFPTFSSVGLGNRLNPLLNELLIHLNEVQLSLISGTKVPVLKYQRIRNELVQRVQRLTIERTDRALVAPLVKKQHIVQALSTKVMLALQRANT